LSGITINSDKGIRPDIGDGHTSGKGCIRYTERRNVQQILSAMRVGVETEYSVIAEPRSEDEDVIGYTAIHCVVARSAIQNICTFASREDVVASATIENVLPVAASDRVLLDSSGQCLANSITRTRRELGAKSDGGDLGGVALGGAMVMTDTQRRWLYVLAAAMVGGAGAFLLLWWLEW
jgi:hypothetical protein